MSHLKKIRSSDSVVIAILLIIFAGSALSQTKWFKYKGNPIFDVGPRGAWDEDWIHMDRIIFQDSVYRLWYGGGWDTARIGHATSRDGVQWKRDKSSPVFNGRPGSWESNVYRPTVIVVGSTYHMWYVGDNVATRSIGYASSKDGIVWRRHSLNPVLRAGPPGLWDEGFTGNASVVGPDASGGFKMWYQGQNLKIGFATATDKTTWTKHPDPVFWGNDVAWYPRVIFNGQFYEMWCGLRDPSAARKTSVYPQPGVFGYITSADGIQWTESPENPVLRPGPDGTWDDAAIVVGDVVFDGQLYHMWYNGDDGSNKLSGGYAVSPKGLVVGVSASNSYMKPRSESVRFTMRVKDPKGLSFSAKIRAGSGNMNPEYLLEVANMREEAVVELLDDGSHGDSLAGDLLFANSWTPTEEKIYFVDLGLRLRRRHIKDFLMYKAAVFTSIGPIECERAEFVGNPTPNPGDTVLIKLTLRNRGSSAPARSVSASLSSSNASITSIKEFSPTYGDILAGKSAATLGYYQMLINPYSPVEADAKIDVTISSWGIPLWYDALTIRVHAPWWRSTWAYAFYGVLGLCVLLGLWRLEMTRTRRKHQLEMERFEAEKLRDLDHLKSHFFANISHEFRTPLTLIEGPAKQLTNGEYPADVIEQAGMIVRNSQRLLHLVNQLLDLSKIESGQMKVQVRGMDLVEVVRGTAAAFESFAKRKEITYVVTTLDGPVIGWFDRDAVEKIVTNLLSNAFKFTGEGGEVVVKISIPKSPADEARQRRQVPNQVVITVSDTGIGIPEVDLPHIFDRFYQVDASQTRGWEGTGIGLALTKELVELHKGEINVTSEVGKGASFTVRLPLDKEHFKPDEIVQVEDSEAVAVDRRVSSTYNEELKITMSEQGHLEPDEARPLLLIVEDNGDMRKYMRSHLDDKYKVIEAVNGEEGVQKAIDTIPDLIISDVMMPKMDGFEVCRKLKTDEKTSHIPVILLTAKAAAEHKLEGLELGADDYLTKPFDAKELLARMKNLIEQRKKLREKFRKEGTIRLKDIVITSADERFLNRAIELVQQHIQDQKFTTDDLAHEMFMSRMQLHRKIRGLTDLSPGEFVRRIRLERARELLRRRAATIAEIAYQVGYEDPARFSDAFRTQFGVLPSEFVKEQAN